MKYTLSSTTETTHRVSLDREDILKLVESKLKVNLPAASVVLVKVPGGGDWSNTELYIDKHVVIEVTFKDIGS